MKEKEKTHYTVEREFLNKFSAQELLIRIIKSHLDKEGEKRAEQVKL